MVDPKPILCWTFIVGEETCCDQSAADNKEQVLSQAWMCWRTADGAKAAAEEWLRQRYREDEVDDVPVAGWRDCGNCAFRWNVDDDMSIEVHPLRVQD